MPDEDQQPESNIDLLASKTEKVKVDVKHLEIGMYVCELDRPWLETNFMFQGFELKSSIDIKALRDTCEYVYIDKVRQNKAYKPKINQYIEPANAALPESPHIRLWLDEKKAVHERRRAFQEEIENAEKAHYNASDLIGSFMDDVYTGHGVNTVAAQLVVTHCVESILNTPDALMWMTQLKDRDQYTAQHSMNVCALSIAFGRHIGLSTEELNQLGLCGMMHDMGKLRVPLDILNKPGQLEPEEMAIMQKHTVYGRDLLMSTPDMFKGAIEVAYSHHEQLDGHGYTRRLIDVAIPPYARIVAIVDMYDAITSDRVYKKGRSHWDAINIMNKAAGAHIDPTFMKMFTDFLGFYPVGSIVEMTNGEVGIVVETNPEYKMRPKIITLLDELKTPKPARLVDISKLDLDASGQMYTIKRLGMAEEYSININKLYTDGLLQRAFSSL